ncbi:predicted protein [Naegleria gruberi]|uniref:Predicted protein n=1 Tax=Naegleria gruberi TaxID=5762 RepID=D2V3X5_NAEGR|nr:uncharacterized protein NAEGRDRAFT_46496 [Naegleria gruberi]EFC48277.1 predicted protein [Naegleria gruberi]|eukprot:XP_002681021.1 predicted protein [Naegleria gruberi strain NEG-M]
MKEFSISYIEPEDLKTRILQQDTSFAIIDVRDYDYGSGHIKTPTPQQYHHIPIDELIQPERARQLLSDLSLSNNNQNNQNNAKSMDLIFHCFYSQQRGPYGAQKMSSLLEDLYNNEDDGGDHQQEWNLNGVNVKVLRGGWGLWRTRFYLERDSLIVPLESDSSSSSSESEQDDDE